MSNERKFCVSANFDRVEWDDILRSLNGITNSVDAHPLLIAQLAILPRFKALYEHQSVSYNRSIDKLNRNFLAIKSIRKKLSESTTPMSAPMAARRNLGTTCVSCLKA